VVGQYTIIKRRRDAIALAKQLDSEMAEGDIRQVENFAIEKIQPGMFRVDGHRCRFNFIELGEGFFWVYRKTVNHWINGLQVDV
jgi:hypothetical protein